MVRQDHDRVDCERMRRVRFFDGGAERLDVVDQRPRGSIRERDGKEEAQRRDRAVDRGRLYSVPALVHLKPANVLSRRRIGRPPKEPCELRTTRT